VSTLPLAVLLLIFVAAAAAIWVAGISLSNQTDVLATRLHLGSALGGLVLLAVATNLPEIAIVVSASAAGNVGVAVGNILGGIAIQTVVLVVLDAFGVRGGKPLTYRAASLVLVLEAALVVAVLAVVIAATQLPASLIVWRLTPAPVLITVLWVVGLLLLQRAGKSLPWHEDGDAPDGQDRPRGHRRHHVEQQATRKGTSTAKSAVVFGVAAVVTLVAGVFLERNGDAIADHVGLSGVLFGGNAFLPVLFLIGTLVSGQAILPHAEHTDIYLTALAALLTLVYAAGLLFRPRRRVAGIGVDSLVVLVLYAAGIGGLIAIATS
jgi:cation:H+ antiporter